MSEFLKNNPIALRHCLLFEVLQGTSIDDAYSKFCNTLGEDFMEYKEFEFWYQRFSDRNYDMNFERERGEDEKVYELSDMPLDVMEKIVEHLDIIDRSALARTSRSLQKFVENQKLFHDNLTFETDMHSSKMKFGEKTKIVYIPNDGKYFVSSKQPTGYEFQDLKNILKQPKLHLDSFSVNCKMSSYDDERRLTEETLNETINGLKAALKFTHQLNVKELILDANTIEPLAEILPFFKPGYLTTINLTISDYDYWDDFMEEVVKMEQWKQAKYFTMDDIFFFTSLHHLYHFKEFDISCRELSVEDIREMKEILFKSPDFERCSIKVEQPVNKDVIGKEFGDAVPGFPNIYHYSIPNSTDYFEIELSLHRIDITREKI